MDPDIGLPPLTIPFSSTMRAVQVKAFVTGPQDLRVSNVAERRPQADEYLVEICACGANFFDLLLIRGKYQWVDHSGSASKINQPLMRQWYSIADLRISNHLFHG